MEKNKNGSKIIITLLVIIIILLVCFLIFFMEEFIDERHEFINLYNHSEGMYTGNYDKMPNNSYNSDNNINVNNNGNNSNTAVTDNNKDTNNINKNYITKENALKIALDDEQISRNDIYDIEVELDYKYNQTVYEVTFNYQKYEYEYYINAENGNILKSFREID